MCTNTIDQGRSYSKGSAAKEDSHATAATSSNAWRETSLRIFGTEQNC